MKYKEIKSMSKEEIGSKLKELQMDLVKVNAQVATGTVPKNPGQLKQTKKTIAKIMQALGESDKPEIKKTEAKAPVKKENKEEKSQSKAEKKPEEKIKTEEQTE